MGATSRAIKPVRTSVILLKWAPEHDDLEVKDEARKSLRMLALITDRILG
jgi:hypothetical protein